MLRCMNMGGKQGLRAQEVASNRGSVGDGGGMTAGSGPAWDSCRVGREGRRRSWCLRCSVALAGNTSGSLRSAFTLAAPAARSWCRWQSPACLSPTWCPSSSSWRRRSWAPGAEQGKEGPGLGMACQTCTDMRPAAILVHPAAHALSTQQVRLCFLFLFGCRRVLNNSRLLHA